MEPGKYPYVSPKKVSLIMIDDVTETARYPLVKVHGKMINRLYKLPDLTCNFSFLANILVLG